MAAFILIVSLAFWTSILLHRQTKKNFSVVFLVVFLMLFCLTEKRVRREEEKFAQVHSFSLDD